MNKNLIAKAAKANYALHYAKAENKGKEIHHVFGRVGILRACPLFFAALTKAEHGDYILLKLLRIERRACMQAVVGTPTREGNYKRGEGCKAAISERCYTCLMLLKEIK